MEKPASVADVPGYIYCYEIRDPKTPNEVQLKVGRAVNMVKRLDEWSKQCVSKEVVLRGWWPGKILDDDGTGPSLLKGRIQAGDKGKFCHRLERMSGANLNATTLFLTDGRVNGISLQASSISNCQI